MFNAVMRQIEGPVDVVMISQGALDLQPEDRDRVTVHVLPQLIRGYPLQRARDVRRFNTLLATARLVLIPGADTVDGGHPHATHARLNLAHLAIRAKRPVRIQGFSWSADAPTSVADSMRAIARHGRLLTRDPLSHRRLTARGVPNELAADLVFAGLGKAVLPASIEGRLSRLEERGRRVVLLNTSGLIHRTKDLRQDYRDVVAALHQDGLSVAFLPHVVRAFDDDLVLAEELFVTAGGDEDLLVAEVLAPEQVQALARRAALSITGRMHLAINSLSHGTPAITLATAGKVEGLAEMFGMPELCIEPRPGCAEQIIRTARTILDDEAGYRARIDEVLPEIRRRASLNYGG